MVVTVRALHLDDDADPRRHQRYDSEGQSHHRPSGDATSRRSVPVSAAAHVTESAVMSLGVGSPTPIAGWSHVNGPGASGATLDCRCDLARGR